MSRLVLLALIALGCGGPEKPVVEPTRPIIPAVKPAPEKSSPQPAPPGPAHSGDVQRQIDRNEACPERTEDRDDRDDSDGCPDLDNDRDGVADIIDECPHIAGRGEDGCPK